MSETLRLVIAAILLSVTVHSAAAAAMIHVTSPIPGQEFQNGTIPIAYSHTGGEELYCFVAIDSASWNVDDPRWVDDTKVRDAFVEPATVRQETVLGVLPGQHKAEFYCTDQTETILLRASNAFTVVTAGDEDEDEPLDDDLPDLVVTPSVVGPGDDVLIESEDLLEEEVLVIVMDPDGEESSWTTSAEDGLFEVFTVPDDALLGTYDVGVFLLDDSVLEGAFFVRAPNVSGTKNATNQTPANTTTVTQHNASNASIPQPLPPPVVLPTDPVDDTDPVVPDEESPAPVIDDALPTDEDDLPADDVADDEAGGIGMLLVGVLAVVLLLGAVGFEAVRGWTDIARLQGTRSPTSSTPPAGAPLPISDAVRAFILEERRKGYDDLTIRSALIARGWKREAVDAAFDALYREGSMAGARP